MQKHTRWTSVGLFVVFVAGMLLASASGASAQIKPYFLVVVDTSGSMSWCAPGQNDCSCHAGNNCGNAFLTNVCGFDRTRIGDAKCALQRIIDSTGDATFGLMQFKHTCSATCAQPGSGSGLCDGQLVVPIQSNNAGLMREWVDGVCQPFASGESCSTDFSHELTTGQGTPIGKSLVRANEYLRGSVTPGSAWEYPTNPAGFNTATASPVANDAQLACRPVSVILLTDGAESCGGNAVTAATALNTGNVSSGTLANKAFRTYVIGFGTTTGAGGSDNYDPTALNNIASAGGTDANAACRASSCPTADRFFPASNEAELSVALNQIIADAQAPAEVCNGADDDCDTLIDEGLTKYCDKPGGHATADLCTDPGETKCDGKDDNCDGLIDNGFAGVCSTCTSSDKEVCDGIDNDCDQIIDEDTSSGAECGPSEGECKPGLVQCIAGEESCEGGIGPKKETCDCLDNDCDGNVDEDAGGNELCGTGGRCVGCKCVDFCDTTAEFMASCKDAELTPEFQPNGECLCIDSDCDPIACSKETVKRGGEVACSPTDKRVSSCECRGGMCAPRCDGVTCASGQACNPRSGRCVENNCRGLGCDAGKICEPVSGDCILDECKDAGCDADEVCRGGECEATCAGVECGAGQLCDAGKCTANKCAAVSCKSGQTCDPDSGKCVANACAGVLCKTGQACDFVSGECIAEPCWDVKCPSTQVCAHGQCMFGGINPPATGSDGEGQRRLLAAGGGGCACSVPGPARSRELPPFTTLATLLAAGLVLTRRSRRRKHAKLTLVLLLLSLSVLAAGCKVRPLCLDCVEKSENPSNVPDGSIVLPDGRVIDPNDKDGGAGGGGGSGDSDSGVDAGDGKPQCQKTGEEVCDDKDNDCDFKVDEEVTPSADDNTCLQNGVCAHTKPVCVRGEYVCHYASTSYEADEVTCDGKDNDCDGKIDDDFPKLGEACQVGVGECRVNGTLQCKATGTSLACSATAPKQPSAELCDGKDNDCDGLVDEPMTNPGSNPSYVDQLTVAAEICDGIDNDCDGKIDEPKADPGFNTSYVQEDVVQVSGSLWVHKYEASRPDATLTSQGALTSRPCSRANVLPWTNVTFEEAQDACAAAGMTLCEVNDWISACEAGSNCGWAYTPASGTCDDTNAQDDVGDYVFDGSNGCVQHDVTAAPGSPDTDALAPTGSKPQCYADHASGDIFDLSGNAKEWTSDTTSPAKNPLRGGSYNNAAAGLRCDFSFAVGGPSLRLPNIGFRCCSATDPN